MNVLVFYNSTQTYTNAVFEHVNSFAKYSKHDFFFCHSDQYQQTDIDLSRFDAVIIHFSIRLPYDQVSEPLARRLVEYKGLKALFIQDEYDHTHRSWHWINRLGIALVFTVVPTPGINRVYPVDVFPNTRFVSNLTGYVPESIPSVAHLMPPSQRNLMIGYRGRPLPVRYGQLGFEKVAVGRLVKSYCDERGILNDISWTEESRIYGDAWYKFMATCKSMLGSESGSNVFDWDGKLVPKVAAFQKANSRLPDAAVYSAVVEPHESPGLMNQVSPRVFEAIALRTALVMFEGNYSGVLRPNEHFIPLRKDGSNLDEVFSRLKDGKYVDEMTDRAYLHVIESRAYSYKSFVQIVDAELEKSARNTTSEVWWPGKVLAGQEAAVSDSEKHTKELDNRQFSPALLSLRPLRAIPLSVKGWLSGSTAYFLWSWVPANLRNKLRPWVRRVLRKG